MRLAFVVFNLDGMGGTSRSAITQANALASLPHEQHDVRLVSITRSADAPHYDIDQRIAVQYLADVRDAPALHDRPSVLVPPRWDGQFSALTDAAMLEALPRIDADVVVTVTPALLAAAAQLVPRTAVLVHQEHRSSSDRTSGLEPLLAFAPRADVVAMLTPSTADWLRDQLGEVCPEIVVMPNPLPLGFTPRSNLDQPLIVSAGRLVMEKQFGQLVQAFSEVADRLPDWRLRIHGDGPARAEIRRQVRKLGLYDRVELPGSTTDMAGEWAKAGIAALTSRAEGFPLVVQEAMAAGVPVASFDSPSGPREIIEHEVNGLLVAQGSTAGMASALLRLATDDDLRRRLGAGARASSAQYDAHDLAARWTRVFEDARARRGTARPAPVSVERPDRTVTDTTPAQARTTVLAAAAGIARSVSDTWFVIPAHESAEPTVVLPMEARDRFLAGLADAALPAYLSLVDPPTAGWPERRGPVAALAADLRRGRRSRMVLEPWPDAGVLGQGCGVAVEFWEESPDGELVAPGTNRYAHRIPRGAPTVDAEVEGVPVRTLPLMAEPTVNECRFPVDVVYTWVDGADDAWNDARERRLAALTGTALTRESSGRARFLSRDELRYSMRSVHLFAPWVRRIHLVTAGQVPAWLDTGHPQVQVVDHRDILPADALPTFNSHAIETSLHRLPDLAEHFIYFNDDMLLGRPLRPETFFSPGGLFATFLSDTAVGLDHRSGAAPYLKAAINNRDLLREAFGVVLTTNLAHAPYPHRRSVLEEVSARFPEPLAATARSPFRSDTDVSMLSSLGQHYGLLTGRSYVGEAALEFVNLSRGDVSRRLRHLLRREQDFICLGDHHDHALDEATLARLVAEWFVEYFPVAAPWELTS